ncbi:MAG: ISNCY family transposase, partial [Terriglobales bacterium]
MERRRHQRSFADGFITEQVDEFWDDWMRAVDRVLDDEHLVETVYEALVQRRAQSRTRGRPGFPADVVVRLLLLKHMRNWSFAILEREVRTNLLYRQFTRVGGGKVPDAKTLGRLALAVGPDVVATLHQRVVAIAQEAKVVAGRKMRVDTTVVETNIHYPTDSSLLGDGVRVLTRLMKQVTAITGTAGATLRDRTRSVKLGMLAIGRASRNKSAKGKEKLQTLDQKLVATTGRVVGQAKRFVADMATGVKSSADVMHQAVVDGLKHELEVMLPRVQQVIRQTKARVLDGNTRAAGKLVSIFEPTTEIIRKGKASKPTEFGKLVKIQEAERQIITAYEVFAQRPSDCELLVPAIQVHHDRLGRVPDLVAADPGFYSARAEMTAKAMGVKRVSVPATGTKSAQRKQEQKKRWFKKAQKWRTGCEGRISLLKRRHGLNRCRYKGDAGMKRWVGLGVIGDNLINLGVA